MSDKTAATFHPRPCPDWICQWCGHPSPTSDLGRMHEARCTQRVEDK